MQTDPVAQSEDLEVIEALRAVAFDRAPVEFWDVVERAVKSGQRLEDATDIYAEILIDVMAYAMSPDGLPSDIEKHATHDQLAHGRRGGGLGGVESARLADLPDKARAGVEKWCEKNGVDIDAAADDMLLAFDSPSAVEAGGKWYEEQFKRNAEAMAERQGISVEEATAAIAITSARTRWAKDDGELYNVKIAERFYQDRAAGKYDGMTAAEAAKAAPNGYLMGKGFGLNVIAMQKGEMTIDEAVTGAKRRSFYNNGLDPASDRSATMDVWMGQFMARNSGMTIAQVQTALSSEPPKYLTNAGHKVSPAYFALREATMRAHDRAVSSGRVPPTWLPHQTQATAWVAISEGMYGEILGGEDG